VLLQVAGQPGLSSLDLAVATQIAPASVSEHLSVLRRNHLVTSTRTGHRLVHTLTHLGRQLLN
jgi:DNA-binding transcriptional ArsR family regulator